MTRQILLVDAPLVYQMNISKLRHLRTTGGRITGGLFGAIRSVESAIRRFEPEPDNVYLCFESNGTAMRRNVDPAYKGDRPEREFWYQDDAVQLHLWASMKGLNFAVADGTEADDVIASLALHLKGPSDTRVIVMSKDHDFKSLLEDNKVYLYEGNAKDSITTAQDFRNEYGFDPRHYPVFLALNGDSSDNVRKVVDRRKATELINVYDGKMQAILSDLHLDAEDVRVIQKNYLLVSMMKIPMRRLDVLKGIYDPIGLREFYERFEMKSLAKGITS